MQSSPRRGGRGPAPEPTPQRLLMPGEYRAPEGDELDERELAALAAERPLVRASGTGPFPGTSLAEAMARIEGELGAPHLPYLPQLPATGWKGTATARTLAICEGIAFDGASFGWRMVHSTGRGARESALAEDRLLSDINLLADRVGSRASGRRTSAQTGGERATRPAYKIQLTGPLSLAAQVYLPGGERAMSDAGASRDLLDSFLEGMERWFILLREALQAPTTPLAVQFDEPEFQRLLEGSIPTVSGFRTLPAIEPHVYREAYRRLTERCADLNLQVILNIDGTGVKPLRAPKVSVKPAPSLDALEMLKTMQAAANPALPCALMLHPDRSRPRGAGTLHVPPLSDPRSWEPIAQLVDAGARIWLPVVTEEMVPHQARRLFNLWREVGLEAHQLSSAGLMPDDARLPAGGYASLSLTEATASLARVTECARALGECGV